MADDDHFVQFYDSDEFLIHSVGGFIGSALARGDAGIVVATKPHREALDAAFADLGLDPVALADEGRYLAFDADETLAKISVGGMPDEQRFHAVIAPILSRLEAAGLRVRAFGEMVSLLVERGSRPAAIRLEELWNHLAATHRFSLFCAYPLTADLDTASLSGVCRQHTGVIPAESYSALDCAGDRMRAIVQMQQRVRSLEAELAKRNEVERAFLRRLRTARV
jgi:hypothetical protein